MSEEWSLSLAGAAVGAAAAGALGQAGQDPVVSQDEKLRVPKTDAERLKISRNEDIVPRHVFHDERALTNSKNSACDVEISRYVRPPYDCSAGTRFRPQ